MKNLYKILLLCGKHTFSTIVVPIVILLFYIGVSLQYHGFSNDDNSEIVIILLSIPMLLLILIYNLEKEFYLRGLLIIFMSISLAFNIFSWFFYTLQVSDGPLMHPRLYIKDADSLRSLSYISISMATALVTGALFVTWLIMHSRSHPTEGAGNSLADEIRSHTFRVVLFFLGVFISIAYLLSFAFAFHDKAVRQEWDQPPSEKQQASKHKETEIGVALYTQRPVRQIRLPKPEPQLQAANPAKPNRPEIPSQRVAPREVSTTQNNLSEPITTSFLFQKKSATLEDKNSLEAARKGSDNQVQKGIQDIITHNENSLKDVTQKLSTYRDKRLRIILVGHTNKDPVEGNISDTRPYRSNHELSSARIYRIHSLICERLEICISYKDSKKWEIIEWLFLPISSEYFFIGKDWPSIDNKDDSKWFSVELLIRPHVEYPVHGNMDHTKDIEVIKKEVNTVHNIVKDMVRGAMIDPEKLDLMDYIYFTVYTITTTGYGDIIPVTGFSKFIVTLSNLFEIIFLVIFFNVLLSSDRKRGEETHSVSTSP